MVATVLHRSIGQGEGGEITGDFPDKADVSDWAVPSMAWAVDSGIVHGNNGMLEPQRAITRAEMATMLLNAHDAGLAPLRAQRPQRRRVQCKRRGHDAPCVALSPHLQSPPSHRLPASRRPQPPAVAAASAAAPPAPSCPSCCQIRRNGTFVVLLLEKGLPSDKSAFMARPSSVTFLDLSQSNR